jgi:hypothetical protein
VFRLAAERSEDWQYGFRASVLEIYNENLYDLLVAGKEQDDKLDVKQVRLHWRCTGCSAPYIYWQVRTALIILLELWN